MRRGATPSSVVGTGSTARTRAGTRLAHRGMPLISSGRQCSRRSTSITSLAVRGHGPLSVTSDGAWTGGGRVCWSAAIVVRPSPSCIGGWLPTSSPGMSRRSSAPDAPDGRAGRTQSSRASRSRSRTGGSGGEPGGARHGGSWRASSASTSACLEAHAANSPRRGSNRAAPRIRRGFPVRSLCLMLAGSGQHPLHGSPLHDHPRRGHCRALDRGRARRTAGPTRPSSADSRARPRARATDACG